MRVELLRGAIGSGNADGTHGQASAGVGGIRTFAFPGTGARRSGKFPAGIDLEIRKNVGSIAGSGTVARAGNCDAWHQLRSRSGARETRQQGNRDSCRGRAEHGDDTLVLFDVTNTTGA